MEINGQSYSLNNTKKELYFALSSAMFCHNVEEGETVGLNESELNNIENIIEKYLNSEDENDVKIAQTYKDFIDDLKAAEEEYRNSDEYKSDKENEKKYLEGIKKETQPYNKDFLSTIKDKFNEFTNKEITPEEEELKKQEEEGLKTYQKAMEDLYESASKQYELENQNVISAKTCYKKQKEGPLSTDTPIDIAGEKYFRD